MWSRAFGMTAMLAGIATAQVPPAASQNPSPMVEHTRTHERIEPRELAGVHRSFDGPLAKPVDVFVPASTHKNAPITT